MNIAVLELENKIRKIISNDNARIAAFEYTPLQVMSEDDIFVLTVSTFNEATKEVTVMYKTKPDTSKEVCLAEVVNYLEVIKPTLSPYTMIWKKKGDPADSTKSYFYVNNVQEILDKFFSNRKIEEYVIFSINMNGYA